MSDVQINTDTAQRTKILRPQCTYRFISKYTILLNFKSKLILHHLLLVTVLRVFLYPYTRIRFVTVYTWLSYFFYRLFLYPVLFLCIYTWYFVCVCFIDFSQVCGTPFQGLNKVVLLGSDTIRWYSPLSREEGNTKYYLSALVMQPKPCGVMSQATTNYITATSNQIINEW